MVGSGTVTTCHYRVPSPATAPAAPPRTRGRIRVTPVITFLSDFGPADGCIGICRAVIAGIAPGDAAARINLRSADAVRPGDD